MSACAQRLLFWHFTRQVKTTFKKAGSKLHEAIASSFFFYSLIHPIPPCPEPRTTDSKVGWLLFANFFCGNQVCCEVTTPNCSLAASTVLVRTPIRHSYPAQSCLTFPTSTDSSLPVAWITGPATDPS